MAIDKLVDSLVDSAALDADLLSIANAIRTKGGTSAALAFPADFVSAVEAITTGGGGGLAYDMGTFTLSTDENAPKFTAQSSSEFYGGIPHDLGETPDFILVWTDEWAGITEAPYTTQTLAGYVWCRNLTGMAQRGSASVNVTNPMCVMFTIIANDYRLNAAIPTSASYGLSNDRLPTSTHIFGPYNSTSTYWRAGAVYNFFVSKAWWNVGGE